MMLHTRAAAITCISKLACNPQYNTIDQQNLMQQKPETMEGCFWVGESYNGVGKVGRIQSQIAVLYLDASTAASARIEMLTASIANVAT
jgi:hypothetical protein